MGTQQVPQLSKYKITTMKVLTLTLVWIIRNAGGDILCGGQDDSTGGGRHLSSCVRLTSTQDEEVIKVPSLPSPRTQAHSFINMFGSLFVCGGRLRILITSLVTFTILTSELFSEVTGTVL